MSSGKDLLCGGYSEYTPTGKSYFVKSGRYYTKPQAGDVVYFYSQSLKRVSHVGIVISVNGTKFKTIEGNTSSTEYSRNGGCVASHEYDTAAGVGGNNKINGFGRPRFGTDTSDAKTFIDTAYAEIGYKEKKTPSNLDDKNANAGYNNYTKYGKWYGDNGAYWCQQFVSWVAYTAVIKYQNNGWVKSDGSKWTYRLHGEYVHDCWLEIDGRWYAFDGVGCMIRGWFISEGSWYYLNVDGGMLAGQWLEDNGEWFYLDKSGAMATDAYVKSKDGYCYVGSDGIYDSSKDIKGEDLDKMQSYEIAL